MTQTPSTRLPAHIYYGIIADQKERDPIVTAANRASVPNGRMSRWERFNKAQELVWVNDYEGTPRALTPKQYQVLTLALEMVGTYQLTMRQIAKRLAVAPSTVSRALTKLCAWGLLAFSIGRGRWSGLVIIRYVQDRGYLDSKRKAAKERIRRWSEAAQRRLSRLALNVAPYLTDEGVRVLETSSSTTSKGATLTASRRWTPDELRDLGIM